jgi:hypothetical protein
MVYNFALVVLFLSGISNASLVAELPAANSNNNIKETTSNIASTSSTSSGCESVLETLSKRKRDYTQRASDAAERSDSECFALLKEEQETPMSIPASCQYKKLSEMSADFRKNLYSFNDSDATAFNPNDKVTKVIGQIRDDLHDMIQSKCESKIRLRADQRGATKKEKEELEKEMSRTRSSSGSAY